MQLGYVVNIYNKNLHYRNNHRIVYKDTKKLLFFTDAYKKFNVESSSVRSIQRVGQR